MPFKRPLKFNVETRGSGHQSFSLENGLIKLYAFGLTCLHEIEYIESFEYVQLFFFLSDFFFNS